MVEEVLKEWGIRNVSTITMDNASSNDVVVGYLKKRLKINNELLGEGDHFHMRCVVHILNLFVMNGLKDQDLSIACIRNAVRFVRSSPQRVLKFKECIEMSRITCKKHVCLDVSTRWNSLFMMLDTAEKFQPAFEKLLHEDFGYVEWFKEAGLPTPNDWEKACMDLNTIVADMGVEMKAKYDKYWGNVVKMNQFLYFGVIFDSRYKFGYIEWSFSDLYGAGSDMAKERAGSVSDNFFKLYNLYKSEHESFVGPSGRNNSSVEQPVVPKNPSLNARADAYKKHLKTKETIVQQNDLERYLSEPPENDDPSFDILTWWKKNCVRYPVLAIMVRDVLATPVSLVASESAFSTGGRILDTYKSSLSPEMAEA